MTTSRGVTDTKIYDREGVIERYGVPPELVPDLIGLKGDTSDNIPGVPGIGDKTAAQLLQRFGSLETVLASVDEISGAKRKENLTNHADDARISKQLATMKLDVEPGVDLEEAMAASLTARSCAIAAEFELRVVIQRLEEEWGGDASRAHGRREIAVESVEGAPATSPAGRSAMAVAGDAGRRPTASGSWTASASHDELAARSAGRPLVAHDVKSLGGGRHGLLAAAAARAASSTLEHDTMIAAYLIDPAPPHLRARELAADAGIGARRGAAADEPGRTTASSSSARRPRRARSGRRRPPHLGSPAPAAADRGPRPGAGDARGRDAAGRRAGGHGARGPEARRQAPRRDRRGHRRAHRQLQAEIYEHAGREFTIGSPQQLGEVLFEELGLSRKRRGKTGFSTDARVLAADPRRARDRRPGRAVARADQAEEHLPRRAARPDRPRDRPDPHHLQPGAAATGRLSSTNPNLQNIPIRSEVGRPVRACFVADEGNTLLSADYNQVELRVLAHVADEDVLREIFASGEDVHSATAAGIIGADPDAIARRALEGEDGQLRHRLRPLRLRARRPAPDRAGGGRHLHRPLLRAVPGDQEVHRRRSSSGGEGRLRVDADGPPPAHPRAALGQRQRATWASAWRSTR